MSSSFLASSGAGLFLFFRQLGGAVITIFIQTPSSHRSSLHIAIPSPSRKGSDSIFPDDLLRAVHHDLLFVSASEAVSSPFPMISAAASQLLSRSVKMRSTRFFFSFSFCDFTRLRIEFTCCCLRIVSCNVLAELMIKQSENAADSMLMLKKVAAS